MSATNSTLNYELPQFIATDKPAWLVDFNGAMSTIDTAIKEAKNAGDNAQTTANTNAVNIQTLDGTVTSQGTAIGTLTTDVAGNTGSINTINSLIGNGQPTTTDKTIIGAINEINAKVGGEVDAEDVSFDNANTGLNATDVQAAIVEVKGLVATPDAEDVAYDNTTSLLAATDVQTAIDEVNSKFGGSQIRYNGSTQSMQYSADGGANWANFSSALSVDEVDNATVAVATGSTSPGVVSLTGTETYTFQSNHEEVLIVANSVFIATSDGATNTDTSASVTAAIPGKTVTQFHNQSDILMGNPLTQYDNYVILDRNTFHVENVEAGDVITFTFSAEATYAQNSKLEGSYDIFTVN